MAIIEIYSKEWCPYCLKAKKLLDAKGLEYTVVDITNDPAGQKRMIEMSGRRTVPQIFIDGEPVGGYDALAIMNDSGALDVRLGVEGVVLKDVYDVVIVGSGPAGMAAAIYASRKNLSVVVVTGDVGGQMGTTFDVANYLGFQLVTGPELVSKFSEHVETHGIDQLVGERVERISLNGRCRVIHTLSGKRVIGRTLIIASGAHKRKLRIPGESELAGRGVVYCSTCDGPLFKGLRIAIVGSGNSALEAVIEMDGMASEVHLVVRGSLKGDDILQDKAVSTRASMHLGWQPIEIHGEERVDGVTIENRATGAVKRLDVDGVFIEIGLYPNSDFAVDVVETNEIGEIKVDRRMRTGARGIFAAGDVTDQHDKQIIVAAGNGATAALAAFEYLATQV